MVLLYKDARCDMAILDETVGPSNWQKEFYDCDGTLFCKVGIRIRRDFQTVSAPYDEWVWKSDAGAPSNMEAEKGEASDAFKRACTNWGIGRELYTAPAIWIPANLVNIEQIKGKYQLREHLSVYHMDVQDGAIQSLKITGRRGVVFDWQR